MVYGFNKMENFNESDSLGGTDTKNQLTEEQDLTRFRMHQVAFVLACISQSLASSTICGYIKCFHPDQIELFGTGQAIAQFGEIPVALYFNYYDVDRDFKYIY